jgi:hypothetical protein
MPLIPIDKINDNPYQPRRQYNNTTELAAAILERKSELPDTLKF